MIPDPQRHFYNQPILYAGFNFDGFNEMELDSPGSNEPVWPVYFESYDGLRTFIITPELTSVFAGCPDLVIPAPRNELTLPHEVREISIRW